MDGIDRRILKALQEDAAGSVAEIADRAGVSQTPCWRRIKRLEQAGYIQRRVAVLDKDLLNLAVTAYVEVHIEQEDTKTTAAVGAAVGKIPEVIEAHHMTGGPALLLKVVTPDLAAFGDVHARLVKISGVASVRASFALARLKETTELPLSYIRD